MYSPAFDGISIPNASISDVSNPCTSTSNSSTPGTSITNTSTFVKSNFGISTLDTSITSIRTPSVNSSNINTRNTSTFSTYTLDRKTSGTSSINISILGTLFSVESDGRKLRKTPEQVDIFSAYTDRDKDTRLSKYLAFKQEKIAKQVINSKKFVTSDKVVTSKEILSSIQKTVTPNNNITSEKVLSNTQVFNSGFVNEIKDPCIDKAHKKSRLVVETYNDNKNLMLTWLPTMQRVYIQPISNFNQKFYILPPFE